MRVFLILISSVCSVTSVVKRFRFDPLKKRVIR